ncbi:MAG: cytochrome c oxidase subunit 3 [Acidimicrobiia bacterium]
MLALPPAPAPARPRMMLVATALVAMAASVLIGSMLALYVHLRDVAGGSTARWVPKGVQISAVTANMLLSTVVIAALCGQIAAYTMRRDNRSDSYLFLGAAGFFGLAAVNAQAYMWKYSKIKMLDGGYATITFVITGVLVALLLAGVVFTVLVAFRAVGGRYSSKDSEGIAAVALYWHFCAVATAAVWYVIYVVK